MKIQIYKDSVENIEVSEWGLLPQTDAHIYEKNFLRHNTNIFNSLINLLTS